jgi:hypothetical protein
MFELGVCRRKTCTREHYDMMDDCKELQISEVSLVWSKYAATVLLGSPAGYLLQQALFGCNSSVKAQASVRHVDEEEVSDPEVG